MVGINSDFVTTMELLLWLSIPSTISSSCHKNSRVIQSWAKSLGETAARAFARVSIMSSCSLSVRTTTSKMPSPKQNTKKKPPNRKTDRRELTDVQKGMIIAFFYCLGSVCAVAAGPG
jgi:hypothetical protein